MKNPEMWKQAYSAELQGAAARSDEDYKAAAEAYAQAARTYREIGTRRAILSARMVETLAAACERKSQAAPARESR